LRDFDLAYDRCESYSVIRRCRPNVRFPQKRKCRTIARSSTNFSTQRIAQGPGAGLVAATFDPSAARPQSNLWQFVTVTLGAILLPLHSGKIRHYPAANSADLEFQCLTTSLLLLVSLADTADHVFGDKVTHKRAM
jgi:hypothetical protein